MITESKFSRTRKFDGRVYRNTGYCDTKADAELLARKDRHNGKLVRVVKTVDGYCMYEH